MVGVYGLLVFLLLKLFEYLFKGVMFVGVVFRRL